MYRAIEIMLNFLKLSDISLSDKSLWNKSVFLTFDMDWACDAILADTLGMVERYKVSATWFVTHETTLLERLRNNPKFEMGIHPNFNFLLNGDFKNGSSADEVVERIMKIVPEAHSLRSHSLTWGDGISQVIRKRSIKIVSNVMIPEQNQIVLHPWQDWYGITHTPYFFQDSSCFYFKHNSSINELSVRDGLKVFNFHPIHVFLNTESMDRYERTRPFHKNPEELIKHRYDGFGTRSRLLELLKVGEINE